MPPAQNRSKSVGAKEDEKAEKAAEAARKASSKKASKKANKDMATKIVLGVGGAFCAGAIALAIAPQGSKKGGVSKGDAYINDAGSITDATTKSEGNFTAAASPFFNRWTVADAQYGLNGITASDLVGMVGTTPVCEGDEGTEGGVIPPSYDARDNWPGCFTEVSDSGNCSASYAIAAVDVMAARFCIADNEKYNGLKLSAQSILSCDTKTSKGCQGGGVDRVWNYIQKKGLFTEECVPYVGRDGPKCSASLTKCDKASKLKVIDHCVLTNEKSVKREIYNRGPVAVPIYLNNEYLTYKDGVYTPTENAERLFSPERDWMINAVALVGWGKSQGNPYWIVRHSWGSSWGENGYARVSMSIVRESRAVAVTPATPEAIEAAEKKKIEDEKAKEQRKIERAERDKRIAEQQKARAAEQSSMAEEEDADLKDLDDDDFDADVDLDDSAESNEA